MPANSTELDFSQRDLRFLGQTTKNSRRGRGSFCLEHYTDRLISQYSLKRDSNLKLQ